MSPLSFKFEGQNVRVIDQDGAPWFVAKDACAVLGLTNVGEALRALDSDEKTTVFNPDGNPRHGIPHKFCLISESGVYALIFKSRKPEAIEFQRWVTREVLPAIRKTGGHGKVPTIDEMARAVLERGEQLRVRDEALSLVRPLGEFGEPNKKGVPKTGIRRGCYVAAASRYREAARMLELSAQMELGLIAGRQS